MVEKILVRSSGEKLPCLPPGMVSSWLVTPWNAETTPIAGSRRRALSRMRPTSRIGG